MPNRVLGKSEQILTLHNKRATVRSLRTSIQISHLTFYLSWYFLKNFPGLALYTDLHTTAQHVDQESTGNECDKVEIEGPYALRR